MSSDRISMVARGRRIQTRRNGSSYPIQHARESTTLGAKRVEPGRNQVYKRRFWRTVGTLPGRKGPGTARSVQFVDGWPQNPVQQLPNHVPPPGACSSAGHLSISDAFHVVKRSRSYSFRIVKRLTSYSFHIVGRHMPYTFHNVKSPGGTGLSNRVGGGG